ncbi:Membrane-bound lytic murein transglycosylase F [Mycoplasmopsis arginini]|uniref:transglycosylase SLT domain-containing protein n=1 Tax=Mycoplasmopsis arginini TaxID=2094 RepID=UPI00249F6865|nr:transglycosylase SLT domain-containing protein [Mycoplasmopsis arginini]MDI3348891.1 Membrane-bound lytic murein transglycosylase F [Mycoplasmopsis arginini]
MDYKSLTDKAEAKYGLPSGSVFHQMMAESNGNPNAKSRVGAEGLMQFMPATAKQYRVDVKNPESSIDGGARYMSDLVKQTGSYDKALAAYNWGPGNLKKHGIDKAPKETRDYVAKITGALKNTAKAGLDAVIPSANASEDLESLYAQAKPTEDLEALYAQAKQEQPDAIAAQPANIDKPITLADKLKFAIQKANDFKNIASPLRIATAVQNKWNDLARQEGDAFGDWTFDKTNSPALATAAKMTPDILNLIAGFKLSSLQTPVAAGNELGKAAERIGYKPNLAQRTNNPDLINLYDTLSNMPGSARVIASHEAGNANAINHAVSKSIGQNSSRVTGDVLANATDDLGAVRNELRSAVNIPQGTKSITDTIDNATLELKKSLRNTGQFKGDMERIKQGVNSGNITGEQYQIWRTDLRDATESAYKAGKTQLGKAYKSVLSSLDDAARGSASPEWIANDKQFSVLNTLQKGNIVNPITGDVSPPLLTNQFYRDFGNIAKQGKLPGEIQDIATITKGYPMLKEGSQTARREAYNSMFPWLMSPINYVGAKALTANPQSMIKPLVYGNAANMSIKEFLRSAGLISD